MIESFTEFILGESSEGTYDKLVSYVETISDEEIDSLWYVVADYIDFEDDLDDVQEEVLDDEDEEIKTVDDVMELIDMLSDEEIEDLYADLVGVTEAQKLKKTSKEALKKAAKYRKSGEGKKAALLQKKKMDKLKAKYKSQIAKCKSAGKTFSLKSKSCVKAKERK